MTDTPETRRRELEQSILRVIYGLVEPRGKWPTFRVVDLRLDRLLGVADTQAALLAVPPRYLRRPWQSSGFNDSDEVRLTLRGVAVCEDGPADLGLLVKFLRWAAEIERARPVEDEGDLNVTSAEFAMSAGLLLEPESSTAGGAETSNVLPIDDGDKTDYSETGSEGEVSPEIADARSAMARLRVIADVVRSFWSGAGRDPDHAWRWRYTLDPRRVRAYRDLEGVAELLDREEPLEHAEPLDSSVTGNAPVPTSIEVDRDPDAETLRATGDPVDGVDSRASGASIDPLLSLLREEIATTCDQQLRAGLFDEAIFAAYRYVESVLQRRAGVTDIGAALVERAFRSGSSPIRVSSRSGDTDRLVQIFSGALGLFKGDRSHKDKPSLPCRSLRECLHQLAHASSLLDLLDRDVEVAPQLRAYDHDQHTLVLRVERVGAQTTVLIGEKSCPVVNRSPGTISVDISDVPPGEHELVLIDGTRQGPAETVWLSREPGRRSWYRVEEINIPLYLNQACTSPAAKVSGIRLAILEVGASREQIVPTAGAYRVGDYVSWQWDSARKLGSVWLKNDDHEAPTQLFTGSLLFDGEPEAPSHPPRRMKVTLQPGRLRLRVGEKAPLMPTVHITDGTATWTESLQNMDVAGDNNRVAYYKDGAVHAKAPGITALRIEVDGLFGETLVEVAAHPRGTATDWITGLPPVPGISWTNNGLVISTRETVLRRVNIGGKCVVVAGLPTRSLESRGSDTIAASVSGDLAVRMLGERDILVLHASDEYASSQWIEAPAANATVMALAWDADRLILGTSDGSIVSASLSGQTTKVGTVEDSPVAIAVTDDALLVLTGGGGNRRLWRLPKNSQDTVADLLNGQGPSDLSAVACSDEYVYLTTFHEGSLLQLAPNGLRRVVGGLQTPTSLAVAPDGTIYVAEFERGAVRRVLS